MITGLQAVLAERGLTTPVDLRGAVVGVAGGTTAEPGEIGRLLGLAQDQGFKLFVVFDGPGTASSSTSVSLRAGESAVPLREAARQLSEANVSWLTAPAHSGAQLAALFRAGVITHVLGGAGDEALLFGDIPLITTNSLRGTGRPRVALRSHILAAFGLPEQGFVEVALGSGCALNPVPTALLGNYSASGLGAALSVAASTGGSLYRAVAFYDQAYVPRLQRALAAVAWQPFLNEQGIVVLANRLGTTVPKDLNEVIGSRLPDEYMWYARQGIVGPDLLRALVWGFVDDPTRSSAGSQTAFASLQNSIGPLRQKALGLLVLPLHRYFQVHPIEDRTRPGVTIARPSTTAPTIQKLDQPLTTTKDIISDSTRLALELAELPADTPIADAPDALLAKAGATEKTLRATATLVLRALAEAVVVYRLATGQASRDLDRKEYIAGMPWAA